jgi:hypothetical protein
VEMDTRGKVQRRDLDHDIEGHRLRRAESKSLRTSRGLRPHLTGIRHRIRSGPLALEGKPDPAWGCRLDSASYDVTRL